MFAQGDTPVREPYECRQRAGYVVINRNTRGGMVTASGRAQARLGVSIFSVWPGLRSAPGRTHQQAMLSFIQINLHKASEATSILGREMGQNKKQTLAFIMEPHTVAGRIVGLPGGTDTVYSTGADNGREPARAGLAASRDLRLTKLDSLCTRDCAAGMAHLKGRRTLVVSAYFDIKKPTVQPWLEKVVSFADSKKVPLLLCADTNAHSSLYGPDNNRRGDKLEDFLLQHGLEVHNTGGTPTFEAVSYTHLTLPTTPYV